MMVGRDIDDQFPRHRGEVGEVLLSVTGLSRERVFQDVGFDLHAGEVLGLAGLVGAGRTEVLRAITGADKYDSGTVRVRGKELPKGKISRAIVDGIGHVPEERKSQGLVLDASGNENLGYATMKSTSHAGLVDRSGQRRRAQNVAEKLRVRMASLDQPVRNLSGGNQQKVVIGRWILSDSSILLLDEPTRGVDVGAKVETYQLINAVTDAGGAVLMVSGELPEVIGMSDRILVMSHGRAMGILDAKTATEDAVMELAVASVDPVDEKKQDESRSFVMPKSTECRLLSIGDDRERKKIIVTTTSTATTKRPSIGRKIGSWALDHGALVGLIILCIALFIATPVFLTVPNIINIGIQAAVVAIMAFGMTFVIVTSGIDLSVGSVAALSAMVSAWMFSNAGLPGWLTLIVGLLIGLLAGAVSGLAIAYGKLPAFIATLAMMSVARGLTLVISGGTPVAASDSVNQLGADVGPIPVPVIMLALAGVVCWFMLSRTVLGRSLYAIGGNEEAARLSGIPVRRILVTVYALAGVFLLA
ncbi:ribose ABC transport system [Cutibacterium acnes JCM 18909]|nr:ribose ABC transport system [Cutibacterium acnes JCM 18909]